MTTPADGCSDSLRPLLDAILPRELVSGGRGHVQAAAPGSSGMNASGSGSHLGSVGSPFGDTPLPHTLSRQSAGEFSSMGDSAHPSRVTSFDMLSVGNPWGDLQAPNRCNPCGTVVGLRCALLQYTFVLAVQLESPLSDHRTTCNSYPCCSAVIGMRSQPPRSCSQHTLQRPPGYQCLSVQQSRRSCSACHRQYAAPRSKVRTPSTLMYWRLGQSRHCCGCCRVPPCAQIFH